MRAWGIYVRNGEYDQLIDEAQPHFCRAVACSDQFAKVYYGAYIGQAHLLANRPDSMLRYLHAITPLMPTIADDYISMIVANILGIHTRNTTLNHTAALAYFHEALQYASAHNDPFNQLVLLNNLARIYYQREDPAGLHYAREVYESAVKLGNDYLRYLGALNLASMYRLTGEYPHARRYADEARRLASSPKDLCRTEIERAHILACTGNNKEASTCFASALGSATDEGIKMEGYLYYGKSLETQRDFLKAERILLEGLRIALSLKNRYYEYKYFKELTSLYRLWGDPAQAVHYEERSKNIADSLFTIERERSFSRMVFDYESRKAAFELHHRELLLMKKSRRLQLSIFTGLTALVVLLALYVLYVKKNRMYRQLVLQYETYRQREAGRLAPTSTQATMVDEERNDKLFAACESLMRNEKLYRSQVLSIEMLCERLDTNRTYLSRMFANKGTSFAGYVHTYRIREAVEKLSDPHCNTPLKALAEELGYGSLNTFYRSFQRETGVPPSRFRREMRNLFTNSQI